MKKNLKLLVLSLFLVTLFLATSFSAAQAGPRFWPPQDPPGGGEWEHGADLESESVPMDELTVAPPADWMVLLANGIHLETVGATELCHPFPGAQDGWEGGIYLLNGNSWLEIPSTTKWMPDEEGRLMTCAMAPMSGTYALFGFCGEDCKIGGPQPVNAVPDMAMNFPKGTFWIK